MGSYRRRRLELVLFALLVTLFLSSSYVEATSWLSGWSNRYAITVSTPSAATNYQFGVNLDTRSFSNFRYELPVTVNSVGSTLSDFQVPIVISDTTVLSHMRSDGGDLRIFDRQTANPYTSTTGKISYWIESFSSSKMVVWVKVPTIPESGGIKLYLYYGDANAASQSNGNNVFEFFDDFSNPAYENSYDSNKWAVVSGNNVRQTNGELMLGTSSGDVTLKSTSSFSDAILQLKERLEYVDATANLPHMGGLFRYRNGGNTQFMLRSDSPKMYFYDDYSLYYNSSSPCSMSPNNYWHDVQVAFSGYSYASYYLKNTNNGNECTFTSTSLNLDSSGPIALSAWNVGYAITVAFDDVRVRKYTSIEPTTSMGLEKKICADVRFTDSDGTTIIPHWQETSCGAINTKFWVKIPSMSNGQTIYSYFGNSGVDSSSSIRTTFTIYEDMQSTPSGTLYGTAGYDSSNRWIRLNPATSGPGHFEYAVSSLGFNTGEGFVADYEIWAGGGSGADATWLYAYSSSQPNHEDASTGGYFFIADEYDSNQIQFKFNGGTEQSVTVPTNIDDSQWHSMRAVFYNHKGSIYWDGTLTVDRQASTSNTLTGGTFGWGGRIGGQSNEHRIRNLQVRKYISPDPSASSIVFQAPDTTPPTTSISHGDSDWSHWHNLAQTITLTCTDNSGGSGCANIRYCYDSNNNCNPQTGAGNDYTSPFSISSSGTHYIRFQSKDNNNNWESVQSQSIKIDRTGPSVSVSGASNSWQSTPATASVSCSDTGGSGCDSATYKLIIYSSKPSSCPTTYSSYTSSSPQTISAHRWVCAAAKDAAGNTQYSSDEEFKIDTTNPTAGINGVPSSWQNTDATGRVTCSDADSGCKTGASARKYRIHTSNPGSCSTNPSDYSNGPDFTASSHIWACAAVEDNSGRWGFSSPIEFKVDKTAPTVDVSGYDPYLAWSPTPKTAGVSCTDTGDSGCDSATYKLRIYSSNPNNCPVSYTDYTSSSPQTISDRNWTCAAAKDVAGNVGYSTPREFKVDLYAPATTTNHDHPNSATADWHSSSQSVTFSCNDHGRSGCGSTQYRITPPGGSTGPETTYSSPLTITQQGITQIDYRSIDAVNNIASWKTTYIKIDNSNPGVQFTTNPAAPNGENNWYTASSVDVTLQCVNAGPSGCSNITYCTTTGSTCVQSTTVMGSSTIITISTQGKTYVNASVFNNAGTRSADYGTQIALDSVAPSVSTTVTPSSPNGNSGWYKLSGGVPPVRFSTTCTDATSKCWKIQYCNNVSVCNNLTISPASTPSTRTEDLTQTNIYAVNFTLFDEAGNSIHWPSSSPFYQEVKLDVDLPQVGYAYIHNGSLATVGDNTDTSHGNITDWYYRIYFRARMQDQPTGSGLVLSSLKSILTNESGQDHRLVNLADTMAGDIYYGSFVIPGNMSRELYSVRFLASDVAGNDITVQAINNRLNITQLVTEYNETTGVSSVLKVSNKSVTLRVGDEKTIFTELKNYNASEQEFVNITLKTIPSGPSSFWIWFSKYKYSAQNRTFLMTELGKGDSILIPFTILGGQVGSYQVEVEASFIDSEKSFKEYVTVTVLDKNATRFSSTPETHAIFLFIACFVVIFLVFSSHKLGDTFK